MVDFAFVPGGGQGGWIWDECIAALKQQAGSAARTLALDPPGTGAKRGRDTSGTTTDDAANELVEDIARAGLKDVVLVGHSNAGTLIPRMIARRRELFRRTVYISCNAPAPGQSVVQSLGHGRHGSHPDEVGWPFDPAVVTDMRERYRLMFCNDMGADTERFLDKLGHDHWPTLAAVQETNWPYDHLAGMPATYVVCLQDQILPVPWQERFAARHHAKRLVRIDAGHQAMNTRPQGIAEILRQEGF